MATAKTYNSVDSKEQLILVQTGKGKFGGYKQELLVNSLNEVEIEFYVCTQCKGVMRNACQMGEEQIPVCETCVGKKGSILTMMKARKKIPELKVNCPLATRGCKWNATLSEVSQHLDVCQKFLIKCKYDCGVIIKRCELNNHCNNECVNREVSCEHCQSMIAYKELNQHFKKCPEFQLLCPNNCATSLKRKQIESHIETDCPNTVVECRYERFGCKQVVKRCELNNHCNNECVNRKVSCEHCQSMIVYKELNQHFKECPEFPLLCPNNCATSLKRKQIDSHIETDCPNTVVECLYERFGCKQVVKRCEMAEHKKTNETKHLEMTTFFAVDKIEKLEETNSKLSKEVIRIRELEKRTEDNMVEIGKLKETNSKLSKEVIRIGDLERSAKSAAEKIASLEKILSEIERANTKEYSQMLNIIEKQSVTESLSYPVVLRDTIKINERGWLPPSCSYDFLWGSINLRLRFWDKYHANISVSIIMLYYKVISPKWPFEGRFKLTIIDRVNRHNSLVHESAVVKLQPEQEPEQGFTLKEKYTNEFEIATIPIDLLLEERFRTENRDIEFTLQIQEAENAPAEQVLSKWKPSFWKK